MQISPTTIPDVRLVRPDFFPDARGGFFESFNAAKYAAAGIQEDWIQDNVSISGRGVLRGLHYQAGAAAQAKLVSVVVGEVYDVAVDIRPESPTYGMWVGATLSEENHSQLYIPRGFAHGFYVLSERAVFSYKVAGSYYDKAAATGIIWNDPKLAITWPLPAGESPHLSEQDAALPPFSASV